MKTLIKSLLQSAGYELNRIVPTVPGTKRRPFGEFEPFLEDLRARGLRPRFVLDVGGNLGDWTRMAKRVFPEARFLLIEPQPETKPSLDSLCREFSDVAYVEAGAGATNGVLTQTVGGHIGASSFLPPVDPSLVQAGKQREVQIVTIDHLLSSRGLDAPDLVKLDIQGFELEALKGASSIFGKTEVFVMEVSLMPFFAGMPIFSEVVEFMRARGYEAYDLPGYFRRPLDGALGQVDIAFARSNGPLRSSNRWE